MPVSGFPQVESCRDEALIKSIRANEQPFAVKQLGYLLEYYLRPMQDVSQLDKSGGCI
jgi:hypothetical protein